MQCLNEWREKFSESKGIYTMILHKDRPNQKLFLAFPFASLYTQVRLYQLMHIFDTAFCMVQFNTKYLDYI